MTTYTKNTKGSYNIKVDGFIIATGKTLKQAIKICTTF